MLRVTVRLQEEVLKEIDWLVNSGRFRDRSELIREAVRYYIMRVKSAEALWELYKRLSEKRKIPSDEEIERLLEELDEEWRRRRLL